ncbi:hypothetical protein ZIOFF_006882 [Zingiber officinale]|uniref:C2H2-type domain-containing protein n=1 Tax=Zingiber officinale TaxID=94328 RepID=A0A8J5LW25_ZINOF|nr:hypothetical protein ZIOFF_006882 [Zingiber officinale]
MGPLVRDHLLSCKYKYEHTLAAFDEGIDSANINHVKSSAARPSAATRWRRHRSTILKRRQEKATAGRNSCRGGVAVAEDADGVGSVRVRDLQAGVSAGPEPADAPAPAQSAPSCLHHDPRHALGDLVGIKKHFRRKHSGRREWACARCAKAYAVLSDFKAHLKICGTRGHSCDCGRVFSRVESFIEHQNMCAAGRAQAERRLPPAPVLISSATSSSDTSAAGGYGCIELLQLMPPSTSGFTRPKAPTSPAAPTEKTEECSKAIVLQLSLGPAPSAVKGGEAAEQEADQVEEARKQARRQLEVAEWELERARRIRQQAEAELGRARAARNCAVEQANATLLQVSSCLTSATEVYTDGTFVIADAGHIRCLSRCRLRQPPSPSPAASSTITAAFGGCG